MWTYYSSWMVFMELKYRHGAKGEKLLHVLPIWDTKSYYKEEPEKICPVVQQKHGHYGGHKLLPD